MCDVKKPESRLIAALDVASFQEAERWVGILCPRLTHFKVGSILFTAAGPDVLEMIRRKGGEVFLDLKFHDIPNTVASACRAATRPGVFMMNLHIVGGGAVLREAAASVREEAAQKKLRKPILLGVTVLTHLDKEALGRLGWVAAGKLEDTVVHLAKFAQENGLDGVVSSPQEIRAIRESCGEDFCIVTPGIRPSGTAVHDQKRVGSPKEALRAGADYLVIGRPILESKDPLKLIDAIVKEIQEGSY
ncbi:MAG: orotidine-5'-phosphate decarboxylase [Candidatus Omnitrophota bacterium]